MNKYSVEKLPRDVRIELAHKHKKVRKQRGLSQVELAERSGVSSRQLKTFRNQRTGFFRVTFKTCIYTRTVIRF